MTVEEYVKAYRRPFKKFGKADADSMPKNKYIKLYVATEKATRELYQAILRELQEYVESSDIEHNDETLEFIQRKGNEKWNEIVAQLNDMAGEKLIDEDAIKIKWGRRTLR